MTQKNDIAENQMGICHTNHGLYNNHGTVVMTNKNNTQNRSCLTVLT